MWLDELNDSELVLLAQDHDPGAHRGLGRDVLLAIITGDVESALPERTIDTSRRRIMLYVLDHWNQVKPLLSCPARTASPSACFNCTDIQVVECVVTNPQIFKDQGD